MHVSAVYRATRKKDDQFISLISKLESTHLLACFSEYTTSRPQHARPQGY